MDGNSSQNAYVYLTHAWVNREDGEFACLAQRLRSSGLEVRYQPLHLQPGENLWDRVSPQITSGDVAGWTYVVTPRSLSDRFCLNQLLAALDRACRERGPAFPLAALLRGVAVADLPVALKLRPCIHLSDSDWRDQVRAVVERRSAGDGSEYLWKVHSSYGGDASKTAIEVCPRKGSVGCWRFAVPVAAAPCRWGQGVSGGGDISPVRFSVVKGAGELQNTPIAWFGSEESVSQTESAYVVFDGPLPEFVCFGRALTPTGPPGKMEMFRAGCRTGTGGCRP